MEFKNREEMIDFEEKRTDYYMESINARKVVEKNTKDLKKKE